MVIATITCSFDASVSYVFNTKEEALEWMNASYEKVVSEELRDDNELNYVFEYQGEYACITWPDGDMMSWEITFEDPNLSVIKNYSCFDDVMCFLDKEV